MAKKTTKKTKPAAAKAAAPKAAPKAAAFNTDALEAVFKPFQQVGAQFGLDKFKDQFEKLAPGKLYVKYEEVNQLGKENVEAFVKSSQILAKAAEEMGKAISTFAQSSMELNQQAGQALLGVKSVQDLVEVQAELARSSMDHMIAGASKISDMAVKVANEAFEPIQHRVSQAIEKATKVA